MAKHRRKEFRKKLITTNFNELVKSNPHEKKNIQFKVISHRYEGKAEETATQDSNDVSFPSMMAMYPNLKEKSFNDDVSNLMEDKSAN